MLLVQGVLKKLVQGVSWKSHAYVGPNIYYFLYFGGSVSTLWKDDYCTIVKAAENVKIYLIQTKLCKFDF
jgi:hypothetical protein